MSSALHLVRALGRRRIDAAVRLFSSTPARAAASPSDPAAVPHVSNAWRNYGIAGAFAVGAAAVWLLNEDRGRDAAASDAGQDSPLRQSGLLSDSHGEQHIVNWSGTHECRPKALHQPETLEELESLVADYHKRGEKLRPLGSALSPNGIGFSNGALVSLALMDKILDIDTATRRVRVQAGCRIAELAEALRQHGLTLVNYASIREQAVGGFVQVGAHGTGARIPTVDDQVVEMTLVTPAEGTLTVTAESDPDLFHVARVGLGATGVLAEVVMQCVPAHQLLEHTFVSTLKDIKRNHAKLLRANQHLRYMWIPHTDRVVVVTNNPHKAGKPPPRVRTTYTDAERLAALRTLLKEAKPDMQGDQVEALTMTELRDELLVHSPLDRDWVARVNQAEAAYWQRSEGYKVGWSDELLGFDCGGQQWVLEAAFPTGTLRRSSGADLAYVEELLAQIEAQGVPAPSPIEQRWSAASASVLSPAYNSDPEAVTSWVGIIMYLPTEELGLRGAITRRFRDYAHMMENGVMAKHGAVEHWAKIEVPSRTTDLMLVRERLAARYPLERFAAVRRRLDPKNILANEMVDALLPRND